MKDKMELKELFDKVMAMMGEPICHDCNKIVDAENSAETLKKFGYVVDRPRGVDGNYLGSDLFWLCPRCALKRYPRLREEGYEQFLKSLI